MSNHNAVSFKSAKMMPDTYSNSESSSVKKTWEMIQRRSSLNWCIIKKGKLPDQVWVTTL